MEVKIIAKMKLKLGVSAKKIKLLFLHVRSISSRLWSLTLNKVLNSLFNALPAISGSAAQAPL